MTCFVELSDEQLIEAYKDKVADYLYYQHADGPMWGQERQARDKCQSELMQLAEEIKGRGMEVPTDCWII